MVKFKLGNFYIVEYNDHFACDKISASDPDLLHPVSLRSVGRLTTVTPTHIIIEHTCRSDDTGPDYSSSIRGIMIPCITKLADLGPLDTQVRKRKDRS